MPTVPTQASVTLTSREDSCSLLISWGRDLFVLGAEEIMHSVGHWIGSAAVCGGLNLQQPCQLAASRTNKPGACICSAHFSLMSFRETGASKVAAWGACGGHTTSSGSVISRHDMITDSLARKCDKEHLPAGMCASSLQCMHEERQRVLRRLHSWYPRRG